MTKCKIINTINFAMKFHRLEPTVQKLIIRTVVLEEKLSKIDNHKERDDTNEKS